MLVNSTQVQPSQYHSICTSPKHGWSQLHGREKVQPCTDLGESSKLTPPHRNAAKARSRDATGRAHKGFFGRQRLEMLSKGLICASKGEKQPVSAEGSGHKMAGEISLAHAKRMELPSRDQHSHQIRNYIPSPTNTSDNGPRSKITNNEAGSDWNEKRHSSKVLEALDTAERT